MKKNKFYIPEIALSGVRGILLDLDNTLYDYEPANKNGMSACFKVLSRRLNLSEKDLERMYGEARKEVKSSLGGTAASHSRLLYFQVLLEKHLGRTDIALTLRIEEIFWNNFFKKMNLKEGVKTFLSNSKKRGIKICLITDLTARIQMEKVKSLSVDKYLDFIVSSEEAGKDKPHEAIFSLALKKLKLRPKECLLIGDDLEKDISGAKAAGIRTVLLG